MKSRWPYLTAIIIVVCLGLTKLYPNTNAQEARAEQRPTLVLSETELDFGEICPAETPVKTIQVTNEGADTITIQNLASTCSCTLAELDITSIPPGTSANLTVRLSVSDYPSNNVNTRVHIVPDDPDPELIVVSVHATITPECVATPNRLDFGEFKLASQPVQTITLKQNGETPVKILRVEAPENFVASFEPVSPKPVTGTSQEVEAHPSEWVIQVKPFADLLPGPLNGRVTIVTNVKRIPNIEIPIIGRVMGIDCTITPKVIVFSPSKPGDNVGTVQIDGSKDLRIANVLCENSELEFTKLSHTDSGALTFDIMLRADAIPGDKGGKLTLELTEGEAKQTFTVPYFGSVSLSP
jgi:hypothetical protein